VESALFDPANKKPAICIWLLGPLTIVSNGATRALPAIRKLRALITYPAIALNAVDRSRFCDLLWDDPNDPRGELRWRLRLESCLTGLTVRG
jgi:DNA-binding SARP family transcriptional activator